MRPVGLRSRLTAVLAAGALVVSAAMAVATYEVTRQSLLQERERSAVRSAAFDAAVVRAGTDTGTPDIGELLRSLDTGETRRPVVRSGGQWYARTADAGITEAIPGTLREIVEAGRPASQRIRFRSQAAIVTGLPLPGRSAAYYEVNSLAELDRTLSLLRAVLALAALGTTTAAALLGRQISRRVLRPVSGVAAAARQLASGDLTARAARDRDPDLDTLPLSFNTMVEQLSERLDRDRRFAADVSHELRSPLQTLTAATSVLDRSAGQLDSRGAQAVRLICVEVDRCSALVGDLLELARSDRPVQLAEVDVHALAVAVCRDRGLPECRVQPGRPLPARLDARRFGQVLANLVDNAQRHGGGLLRLGLQRRGRDLVVEVDDEGPGVPLDERDLVFDRFGRGRTAGSRGGSEGTGLGLALVAQHVAAHGGRVHVEDRAGGGARFVVTVPGAAR